MTKFRIFISFSALLLISACSDDPSAISDASEINGQCGEASIGLANLGSRVGQTIAIEATVHGEFLGEDKLSGLFVQSDSGAAFVRENHDVTEVQVGDRVRVTGTVASYQGHYKLTDVRHFTVCANNQPVTTTAIDFPLSADASLSDVLFQRVRIEPPLTVIGHYQLARFGTLDVASERLWVPTQVVSPGAEAAQLAALNNARRFVLDDGSQQEYPETVRYPAPGLHIERPVRTGDTVSNLEGVFVIEGRNFHFHPVAEPHFEATNPRPEVPSFDEGDLRVVAFNVLNYFNGDGQGGGFPTPRGAETPAEFERQRVRIINTIIALDGDIYALMEMENDGFDSTSAIQDLTRGLNQAIGSDVYAFSSADAPRVGGDAITQALIYRRDRVEPISALRWTTEGAFNWGSRPPLAQNFRVLASNKEVAVVANHFKSKGSCPRASDDINANQGDGQGCWNPLRTQAAEELVRWLESNPLSINHQNYVVLGDFNAYAQEDPIQKLADFGYLNLAETFEPEGYSYVFRGEKGSLDHILAHESIKDAVRGLRHWHVNADEPVAFEYPFGQKTPEQRQAWYSQAPYRASDHDPIIVVLETERLH
ncbi:ExeM/NucH family extracellular endonuclease [Aliidiomarina indica]|uniref:ExeM/NucH family extracellular endonuclease n=1 Tax=Aliidiomarina indica TaxID=2749147 RepID=UPI001890841F